MSVFQRLQQIAKPYIANLYNGLFLTFISTFLDTAVIPGLTALMASQFMGKSPTGSQSHLLADFQHSKIAFEFAHLKVVLAHWINHYYPGYTQEQASALGVLVILSFLTLITVIIKGIITARANIDMHRFAQQTVKDIRLRLFSHLLKQPPAYFESERTGAQLTRITGDVVVLQQCLGPDFTRVIQTPLTIIIALGSMFIVNWHLMLMLVIITPIIALLMTVAGRKIRKLVVRMQERLGDLNAGLVERLANIRIVQSFVREPYEINHVANFNDRYYRETMRTVFITETLAPTVETFAWLGMVLGILFGGIEVINGRMVAADFFYFIIVANKAGSQFKALSRINQLRQQANGAGERIFSTIDTVPEIQNAPNAVTLPPVEGHIIFDQVAFRYHTGHEVLSGIDFTVEPGEVIALVGPSGSGKTTLVNLLPRFYDPTAGHILIDGFDVRDLSLESLREQVGIVPQETMLFYGSIMDNIRYGKLDASEDEILQATCSANALDFVEQLPEGFNTMIGERGTRLSGGQRQRIAIARALLKNPRILILDEATSALDTESEYLVQQALDRLMMNRTTFVIAHRLSTVKGANRLMVLCDGRIVESGTHQDLLVTGGLYARLYEMQFHTPATTGVS